MHGEIKGQRNDKDKETDRQSKKKKQEEKEMESEGGRGSLYVGESRKEKKKRGGTPLTSWLCICYLCLLSHGLK